jgi:hypothetical protein
MAARPRARTVAERAGNESRYGELDMRKIMVAGAILLVLGILGFAIPYFTTSQTKNVAQLGDLKLQTTESTGHAVPPMVAGAAVVLGVLLLGAGLYKKT